MPELLIGLDVGTSTIKALALDPHTGKPVAVSCLPTPVSHPQPELSEHDPEALWQTAAACLRQLAGQVAGQPILGVAVCCFGDTGLPLDAQGRPLYPIIAWYDRRCAPQVQWLESRISPDELQRITGQRFSTSLDAPKWLWIRENAPAAAERTAMWMPAASYILWKLSGEKLTDYSIASRTSLFDQASLSWSPVMLALAGLAPQQLPAALPGGSRAGTVLPRAAEETGLPVGIPCALGGHDHLCAALVTGADRPTTLVDSSDTAESLLVVLPAFLRSPEILSGGYTCYAHVAEGRYVLRGGLRSAGGGLQWLAGKLAVPDAPAGGDLPYAALAGQAERGVGKRVGPIWLPHLMGSGTPENDPNSLGAMVGLSSEHDQGDLFRGMLESLAFWLRQNQAEMEKLVGARFEEVVLLGGTTRLPLFTRLKADILNRPVILAEIGEPAATGAALLAGVGAGLFADARAAAACLVYPKKTIFPDPERAAWYERLYETGYRPLYSALAGVNHELASLARPSVLAGED
jgi:xylulokinase